MKKKLIVAGVLFALFFAALIGRESCRGTLGTDASRAWRGESGTEYRRISVYFDAAHAITVPEAVYAKSGMSERIREGSEEAKLLATWGREEEGEFRIGERELSCPVYLVEENFFLMRRFLFLAGGDYGFGAGEIVLNEYAAHALFGSEDCVGMILRRGAEYESVRGVVRDGLKRPAAYVYLADRETVTFYETILPEYVKGYAYDVVSMYFYEGDGTVIRENDVRYETKRLREELKKEFDETEQPLSFRVPFWEYRERRAERVLTAWNIAVMILAVPAAVSLVPVLWEPGAKLFRWIGAKKEERKSRPKYMR